MNSRPLSIARGPLVWYFYRPVAIYFHWRLHLAQWNATISTGTPTLEGKILSLEIGYHLTLWAFWFLMSSVGYTVSWLCCPRAGSEGEFLMKGVIKITTNQLPCGVEKPFKRKNEQPSSLKLGRAQVASTRKSMRLDSTTKMLLLLRAAFPASTSQCPWARHATQCFTCLFSF